MTLEEQFKNRSLFTTVKDNTNFDINYNQYDIFNTYSVYKKRNKTVWYIGEYKFWKFTFKFSITIPEKKWYLGDYRAVSKAKAICACIEQKWPHEIMEFKIYDTSMNGQYMYAEKK